MDKLKGESLKTAAGVFAVALLYFIADKLGDLVISIFSEGEMTWKKIIFSIALLCLIFIMFVGIQSIWSIFASLKRRVTGETRIEELQKRIRQTRSEILHNLRRLQSTKQSFNSTVDTAERGVSSLRPDDSNFQDKRRLAALKVLTLKNIYQHNISDLEKLVDKAYKDIDAAERIFTEAKSWSADAADKFFR